MNPGLNQDNIQLCHLLSTSECQASNRREGKWLRGKPVGGRNWGAVSAPSGVGSWHCRSRRERSWWPGVPGSARGRLCMTERVTCHLCLAGRAGICPTQPPHPGRAGQTEADVGMAPANTDCPVASQEARESGKVERTKTQVGRRRAPRAGPQSLPNPASSGQGQAILPVSLRCPGVWEGGACLWVPLPEDAPACGWGLHNLQRTKRPICGSGLAPDLQCAWCWGQQSSSRAERAHDGVTVEHCRPLTRNTLASRVTKRKPTDLGVSPGPRAPSLPTLGPSLPFLCLAGSCENWDIWYFVPSLVLGRVGKTTCPSTLLGSMAGLIIK